LAGITLRFVEPDFEIAIVGLSTDHSEESGTYFVSGSLCSSSGKGQVGEIVDEQQYADGVFRLVIAKQVIVVEDNATTVTINGRRFQVKSLRGMRVEIDYETSQIIGKETVSTKKQRDQE